MLLQTIYSKIEEHALGTKGVESFTAADPYIAWNSLNMRYGAFNAVLNYVDYTENMAVHHFTLYYGDRLTNDSSNVHSVQTDGFNAIRNVVRHLEDEYGIDGAETLQIHPFWQKFADALAGAYADVALYVPIESVECEDFDKD